MLSQLMIDLFQQRDIESKELLTVPQLQHTLSQSSQGSREHSRRHHLGERDGHPLRRLPVQPDANHSFQKNVEPSTRKKNLKNLRVGEGKAK